MADLDNLIDSKISLISHQDVRYDGTLFSINTSESSIVLKDVKCLGTEGRVSEESKKVPANPTVIPFVTFPGQEIKDLYVHESPEPAAPPAPARKNDNRAQNNNNNNRAAPKPQSHDNREQTKRQSQPAAKPAHQAPQQQQQRREQAPREPRPTSVAGTGAHLLHMREKKAGDGSGGAKEDTKTVFDFEAGLSVFKKEEVLAKVATDGGAASEAAIEEKKYKKDDFFDMLSTDRSVREETGQQVRLTPMQERSLNQDTFGAIALQGGGGYRRNYSRGGGNNDGRGGGRGRGGRGRGRGYNNSGTVAAN